METVNMTLTVHHLQVSQSERIPWLCEELGIPYNLIIHKRNPVFSPPELASLSALSAAPVIEDTSSPYSKSQPLRLAESAAIVEYIAQRYGDGRLMLPPTHKDYTRYIYWWHFSNGNLQPSLTRQGSIRLFNPPSDHPYKVRLDQRMQKILKHIDDGLAESAGPWLAGEEFTVADIMSVFSLTTMRKFFAFELVGYDHLLAWLQRCADRPAYKAAREKADPGLDPMVGAEVPPPFKAFQQISRKEKL